MSEKQEANIVDENNTYVCSGCRSYKFNTVKGDIVNGISPGSAPYASEEFLDWSCPICGNGTYLLMTLKMFEEVFHEKAICPNS